MVSTAKSKSCSFFGFPYLENHVRLEVVNSSIPDDSICTFCGTVCFQIISLTCGHRVCVLCYRQFVDLKTLLLTCPFDKVICNKANAKTAKDASGSIANVQVYCNNRDVGCSFKGALSSFQVHNDYCDYNEVTCRECNATLLRRDFVEHVLTQCQKNVEIQKQVNFSLKLMDSSEQSARGDHKQQNQDIDNNYVFEFRAFCKDILLRVDDLQDRMQAHEENAKTSLTKIDQIGTKVEALDESLSISEKRLKKMIKSSVTNTQNIPVDLEETVTKIVNSKFRHVFRWKVHYSLANRGKMLDGHEYFSEGFFSHVHGYKIRLAVAIDKGSDKDENDTPSLGLYMSLQPGPYDSTLEWPFRRGFTFRLISQEDPSKFKEDSMPMEEISQDTVEFKRQRSRNESGYGFPQFISLDELESDENGYIQDDCFLVEFFIDI